MSATLISVGSNMTRGSSLIWGVMGPKIVIDKEGAAILALAWRCLYAETVGARAEDIENRT